MLAKRPQAELPSNRRKPPLYRNEIQRAAFRWERIFLLFLTLVCGAIAFQEARAQSVGMSEQKVLAEYGKPQMEMKQGGRKIWHYGNNIKIVIQNGKVVESNVTPHLDSQNKIEVKTEIRMAKQKEEALEKQAETRDSDPGDSHSRTNKYLGTCFWIGLLILIACKFALLYVAFMESVPWALACLIIPMVTIVFVLTHWQATKKIVLCQFFIGIPLIIAGMV